LLDRPRDCHPLLAMTVSPASRMRAAASFIIATAPLFPAFGPATPLGLPEM
jgi:hypothetical protein